MVFVRLAGFAFEFHSVEQITVCPAYYARRHQPTSGLPVQSGEYGGDQHETPRWFERLPLYLREEPKREQVVAALDEALRRITAGKIDAAAV